LFETIPEDNPDGGDFLDDEFLDDEDWEGFPEESPAETDDLDLEWLEEEDETGDEIPAPDASQLSSTEQQPPANTGSGDLSADIKPPHESPVHPVEHPDAKAFFERGLSRNEEKQREHVYQPLVSRYEKTEKIEAEEPAASLPAEPEPAELNGTERDSAMEEEERRAEQREEGKEEDTETQAITESSEAAEGEPDQEEQEGDAQETSACDSEGSSDRDVPEECAAELPDTMTEEEEEQEQELCTGDENAPVLAETESSETGMAGAQDNPPTEGNTESEQAQPEDLKAEAPEADGDMHPDNGEGKAPYQPLVSRYDGIKTEESAAPIPGEKPKEEAVPEKAGSDESSADESGEDIRLFEKESEDSYAHFGNTGKMRSVRTGFGTTTRIHLNQTEEMQRAEAAQQRAEEMLKEEQTAARKERKGRRARILRILRKLFSNVAFVLFLIAAVLIAIYYAFLLSDVIIIGNEKYSSEYILSLSGLREGRHMLMIDMDEAKEKIEDNPYLEVEQMTYIFPNRIRIVIKERKEVAGIVGVDYSVIIDDQGYVLSMAGGTDLSSLVRVTGVSMTGFQLGQKLGEGNDFSTATLVQIIEKLEEHDLIDKISAIDLTTPLAITMTARNGLNIHLGQSTDLDEKMDSLSKLIDAFVEKYISTGTLYLSAKGGTVYSPSDAAKRAAEATIQASIPAFPDVPDTGEDWVDDDGDGYDDNTGNPIATPVPTPPPATPAPTPIAGGSDDFSG
jgi:cell division septal protein FtsQ